MYMFVIVEGKGYLCLQRSLLWIQEELELLDLYQVGMGQVCS